LRGFRFHIAAKIIGLIGAPLTDASILTLIILSATAKPFVSRCNTAAPATALATNSRRFIGIVLSSRHLSRIQSVSGHDDTWIRLLDFPPENKRGNTTAYRFLDFQKKSVLLLTRLNKCTMGGVQKVGHCRMKTSFLCFLLFLLAGTVAAASNSTLPDGTEFPSWEKALHFSKTYYVDGQMKNADDKGPGSKERPFRTINAAAQVLQPGERVVIAEGVYRECIRPAGGGTGPDAMISYEAAPGAKVIVKGAAVVKDWKPS
jgi:hypothetical protein